MTPWRRASWTLRWAARAWPRGKDRSDPVTWVWKAFRERTTPGGKVLGAIWLLLLPVSVLTRGDFGGAAFAMVSATLAAAWLWTLRSPEVSCRAILPAAMREGEIVSARVLLESIGGKDLPLGVGAWIFRTGDGLEAVGDGAMAASTRRGAGEVVVPLRASKRGIQIVEGPSVLKQDPLGLFRSRSLCRARAEILVHPRACRVVSIENLLRGPGGAELSQAMSPVAGDEDFVGIRPWRDGDDIRSLHHRAWARTGKPAVRETEREAGGGVVLSFCSGSDSWSRRSLMDPAIVLAAALARFLSDREALSGFLLDGVPVPLPTRDPAFAIESALARLPGSGIWERRRRTQTGTRDIPRAEPVLSVGFSRDFPEAVPTSSSRGLWVDWGGHDALPARIHRVDPEQILSGEVRL